MRLIFAGTPDVAVPSLRALVDDGHDIVAVVTRRDAPLGRRRVLTPSPVAAAADDLGLDVVKANRLDEAVTDRLVALEADLGVVVAYGGLVREPLLSAPRLGWVNLHFSLLPRWRGASPVQHAVAAGDSVTGAAVFRLVPELDAGDVYGVVERTIDDHDTAGSLLHGLSEDGAALLTRVVDELAGGSATAVPQDGEVTLAPKLALEDARIDWSLPLEAVDARIRAVTPEPGAFTTVDGVRVKVLEARPIEPSDDDAVDASTELRPGAIRAAGRRVLAGTATRALHLLRVQPAGKQPMAASDWWRGVPVDEAVAE